jgi:hypothetical protein
MRRINLKSKNLPNSEKKKEYSGQASLVVGVLLLIISAGLYGGVFYLKSNQDKEIRSIKSQITTIKRDLDVNQEYRELYDFQDRLAELETMTKNKVIQTNVLEQISGATMKTSTLKNLKITTKDGLSKILLTAKVSNLSDLAKQLNAYNQVDANRQALLTNSALKGEDIEAKINLSIRSEDLE